MNHVYPMLVEAMGLADVGLTGTGNTQRDYALESDVHGRAFVEAADVCAATASQLEDIVMNGLDMTDAQYRWFKARAGA